MKQENQVCRLEQAKRLKELGVLQGTYWIWRQEKMYPENLPVLITVAQMPTGIDIHAFNLYSAFTVAELGLMLPEMFASRGYDECWLSFNDCGSEADLLGNENKEVGFERTEAGARAAMLIYLLENKLINVEDVNARLSETALV